MLQVVINFIASRAVYVAARLGLADHVHERPRTPDELAALVGAHGPSLYRVMRATASIGIFAEDEQGRFGPTPLSDILRTGVPGSLRSFLISELGEDHYEAWGELLHSVQTGEVAFDHHFGMTAWQYYEANPERGRFFNESMTGLTKMVGDAVLATYDFSPFRKAVDVGGGHGGMVAAILKTNPAMTGVVYDAPSVVEGARARIEAEGLEGRCEAVGGDFFQAVPEGGDLYILKAIIHDWNDEQCGTILGHIHRAMAPGGTLLIVDTVIPPGNGPSHGKFIDLIMLVMMTGRERTEPEFRRLLAASGFDLSRVVPTPSPMSVIEARRGGS
jgi:hypothetical protein